MSTIAAKAKPIITGAIVFGDSLSDEGRKYSENFCCFFPFKWILHHSDYNNFTNGHTWSFIFANVLKNILKEKANWLTGENSIFFKNMAEGGATAHNYRSLKNFFKNPFGFIMSFFLGNIQKQAKKAKEAQNIFNPNKLGFIFVGANDLVTLGYYDAKGIEKAIQGIIKTIETLTNKNEKTGFNYLKYLLFIGLPDISETPRFKDKSDEEKLKMRLACQRYNEKLQELANEYQYINFDLCTVYNYKNINHLDLKTIKKIEKAIVIIGEGEDRTVIFISKGEFITDKSSQKLKKVNITLSKAQQIIFSKDGEIIRDKINGNKLEEIINKVTPKAKLNIDIKMIGIETILDDILRNPEVHGFTAGCAVYYLPKTACQENDESQILKNFITGNAVIIQEVNNEFFSYLIKDGVLITRGEKAVKVKFELSEINQIRLQKKIKQHFSENETIKLVGMEDIHDICIIDVIKSIAVNFENSFDKKIELTAISESVLDSIKKGYLNKDYIFWDDLHPARRLHELLAVKISEFIQDNYLVQNPLQFRDDSFFYVKSKLRPNLSNEAPGVLSSVPSLLTPTNNF